MTSTIYVPTGVKATINWIDNTPNGSWVYRIIALGYPPFIKGGSTEMYAFTPEFSGSKWASAGFVVGPNTDNTKGMRIDVSIQVCYDYDSPYSPKNIWENVMTDVRPISGGVLVHAVNIDGEVSARFSWQPRLTDEAEDASSFSQIASSWGDDGA